MVLLSHLIERLGGERATGDARAADPEVRDVHLDSRRVAAGTLFAALPGTLTDGARFAPSAVERGASAVLAPGVIEGLGEAPLWLHPDARRVTGQAAALVHDRPALRQRVVGITGTNGKSTVAHLIAHLLRHAGNKPAVIGTLEVSLWGEGARPATHTTPEATELVRLARRNLELGGDTLVCEVSSHALDQERLSGLELDVAVFTNLGHDHLDYHHDLEGYAAAKERIFERLKPGGTAVINADDPAAGRMRAAASAHAGRVIEYGAGSRADLFASSTDVSPRGTHLFLEGMGIPRTGLFLPLVGGHNVENTLAALAAVLTLEASPARAVDGLASVSPPKGRLEEIDTGTRGFHVFVDYAHTPDALEQVLDTLREVLSSFPDGAEGDEGRLICVFGCGGGRDVEKRPLMGEVVGRIADLAIVTSDNPRNEDPGAIIEDIRTGLRGQQADVIVEPNRRAAIRAALRKAEPGDVVLVAGKGHETWQLSRGKRIPFEDQRVCREELP